MSLVNGEGEYVIRKLIPVEHVVWARTLEDAGRKAELLLEKDETLVSVKSRVRFEADKSNGSRF